MHRPGNQFLPRPTLSVDENGSVEVLQPFDGAQSIANGLAFADESLYSPVLGFALVEQLPARNFGLELFVRLV